MFLLVLGNLSKRGGKDGLFQGLAGLLRGISRGREQPCQPEENPVLPDSFTQIYILFLIGFRIGPPKIHRGFRIVLPKLHRQFRIGPPQVTLNLLLPQFHSRWILVYYGYYARKATKLPIWNRMVLISPSIKRFGVPCKRDFFIFFFEILLGSW